MNRAVALLILLLATQAHASGKVYSRKMLDHEDPVDVLDGTDIQTGNQFLKSTSQGKDAVIQNLAQAQAQEGLTHSVTSTVADSIKAGQVDVSIRTEQGGSAAQSAVQRATSSGNAFAAARENQSIISVSKYGQGMRLSTDNRQGLAYQQAQSAVSSSLIGSGTAHQATDEAANSAWESASASQSHTWGGP